KRWMAGFSRKSGSRSAFATAAGLSVPSRCFSRRGPRKACWTVTCWSSAKPTRSAKGSSARRREASSLSVNHQAWGTAWILRGGLHQSAASGCVRRRLLLLEVREGRVEQRCIAVLGCEQRRPRLREAGADAPIHLGGSSELAGGGGTTGVMPQVTSP